MLGFLKWLGIIVLVLVLGIAVFLFGMRFHDGPIEIFTGRPFKTGEPAQAPDDWTYLTDRMEIEFQTIEPDTSRIVWLGVYDTRLYIASGYMNTGYGIIGFLAMLELVKRGAIRVTQKGRGDIEMENESVNTPIYA